ncbi:leucine dehydrogenase [Sphingomonas jejuensis]|uniref:Leucine dehydrogenase n=1 Tax=Sphingomonas jejuensis TaxID=904715 RepID=A0ABX0XKN1_9SPHN|nr:Glu/Leu/Phe/Val dehydrogenase dimerization domain-containing protein [Sphingomonas jejuensis]NJC33290.1 leucine dehydrogenase [Sphingomonas jejuensis]
MGSPWEFADFDDHEGVHFFRDQASGLRAIVAIHSTALGPAAGGVRRWRYPTTDAAVTDALRLSRGMSFKNAMAGLPMGGGKAVILDDGNRDPAVLDAFARGIDSLGGRYVTAEDVGVSVADMVRISDTTRFVSGLPVEGGRVGGDPGPHTALGVFLGVKAAVRRALGKDDVAGVHVAIQGAGSIGGGLARLLARDGARVTVADVDQARAAALAAEVGGTAVDADAIMTVEADVLSPCALGAILTEESIAALRVPVVAGGANNQLATPADGQRIHARGILYAPDYVINAGGIINVALEYLGNGDPADVEARIHRIPERLEQVWAESEASGDPAATVADRIASGLIGRR